MAGGLKRNHEVLPVPPALWKTVVGFTAAKKRLKCDLGITAMLKPLRWWPNQKRRLKREVGYESEGGRLIRDGLPKPAGCILLVILVFIGWVIVGRSILAHCACGYETNVAFGGTMSDCDKTDSFPCLCPHCRRIVDGNLLQDPLTCPECHGHEIVPYDQPQLHKPREDDILESHRDGSKSSIQVSLEEGIFLCPVCETFRLRFGGKGWVIMFD